MEGNSPDDDRYKWVALSNTTLGTLLAYIDTSITLVALPDVFRGIKLDPLAAGNSFYLLWMILGFLVITSMLMVSFGRLGDMYGRVRMYNLGFALYTLFSLLLAATWMTGSAGAIWLVTLRVFQGIGAAFLMANSSAIVTDAFPSHQRGTALGINNAAAVSGVFIGLILGGILGSINWRLIFVVSVPVGLIGTIWAYKSLREVGQRNRSPIDWPGNVFFALGLLAVLIGITYGIEPYGNSTMGWTSPLVLGSLSAGILLLIGFSVIEMRVENPMFRLSLFRIKAFTAGNLATLFAAIGRGGLMFMLIIWLQGVWLPEHGYNFSDTPFWAGIYLIPLTAGYAAAGPASGILSDRYGPRRFAVGGMLGAALCFGALDLLPINFPYPLFAVIIFLTALSMAAFSAPNRAGVMNCLPPASRGVGGGMNATFQSSGQVLSIGIFFTLMVIGLSASLPSSLLHGLLVQGVPTKVAERVSHLPPISTLFAAFLGYNPLQHLLGATALSHLSPSQAATITSHAYFPRIITIPFRSGLHWAIDFAMGSSLVAAYASKWVGPQVAEAR